ncbi:acyl-CoA desaturase [Gemmata sp. JC717]|uniref:acyl-CoA desaturase n=1 Tax=Gemmata algarum TaxID=2975278 RepID=UPI0021BB8D85|nr:acyl-CoA desaturase [Gemmata algarum]MDY3551967.1 acyl-CoA desaturase [Gemmata algarum]
MSWTAVLTGVFVPLAGVAAAAALAWRNGLLGWADVGLFLGMYVAVMLGTTVGFHRLFTHRSFETVKPVQFILGALGSMALQGPLLAWVGLHRIHHQHSDHDGDPHSPHAPGRRGFWGRFRAFWHAHIGWALPAETTDLERYAPDLLKSPLIRTVSALFPVWAALGVLIPAGIGYALGGWHGALTGFLWGGLARLFLGHHATWSVNSVCHLWGTRPYHSGDESRNNPVVGVLTMGEGWHNNHHAFPTSARHGLKWWQLDVSYYVIRLLAAFGLAWNIKLPTVRGLEMRRTAT